MAVVLTTLAATLCMQLGYFLWKLSAGRQPVIGRAPITQVLRALLFDRLWVGGFFATAIGWLLFVRATAIGEISLVQPLMSIGDIVLIGLAVGFLKERLGRQELAGVALTVVGALGLSWSAQVVPLQLAVANALAVGAGVWVFDEQLGPVRLAAIALIGLGTAWMHHHAQPTATASGLAPASPDAVGAAPP